VAAAESFGMVRSGGAARMGNGAPVIENAAPAMLLARIEWTADYSEESATVAKEQTMKLGNTFRSYGERPNALRKIGIDSDRQ
jgi:hypothetical protein